MKQVVNGLSGNEKRAYCKSDMDSFCKGYGFSKVEQAEIFCRGGMSASAFQKTLGNDQDLLSPTLQLQLRLYSLYPQTIPFPKRITTSDFFDNQLGGETTIATRFRGVLFGVDRNSGYNWGNDSTPSAQVMSLMVAATKLKQENTLTQDELLQVLIDIFNATTQSLGVNPMKRGSWGHKDDSEEALKFSLSDVSNKAVKNRGRRVYLTHSQKLKSSNIASLASTVREKLSN